jgi:hypothetical protein
MKKRFRIIVTALVCLASASLADGDVRPANSLPLCYQYPVVGAGIVYADDASVPVPVYGEPDTNSAVVGYVHLYQPILLDSVSQPGGMAYIFYHGDPEEAGWNFGDDCPRGWIEGRFTTFYTDYAAMWVVITDQPGDRLNLRTTPSANSVSLGKYYAGTVVWQQAQPENGYVKVKIGHMAGYMELRFLAWGMYTPDAELPVLTVTGAYGAEVRKLPQNNSEIIQNAPCGAAVTVLAIRDDNWAQVMYENEIGYVRSDTLSEMLSY